jgi:hypothetical protein
MGADLARMAVQLCLATASVSAFVVAPLGTPWGAQAVRAQIFRGFWAHRPRYRRHDRTKKDVELQRGPQGAVWSMGADADPQKIPRTVFVAGATGRVGTMVCEQCLVRIPNSRVRAVFRNETKAQVMLDRLMRDYPGRVELVKCDLGDRRQLRAALEGADQVVYCASAFRAPRGNVFQKIGRLFKIKLSQAFGRALDIRGPALACKMLHKLENTAPWSMAQKKLDQSLQVPRIVMLSSAAVTRPSWDEAKRAQYREAAEIAIVKLNPLNVLGTKLRGENRLKLVRQVALSQKYVDLLYS